MDSNIKSFNRKMKDGLLNKDFSDNMQETRVLIKSWKCYYSIIEFQCPLEFKIIIPERKIVNFYKLIIS